jgi:hypothetical protein
MRMMITALRKPREARGLDAITNLHLHSSLLPTATGPKPPFVYALLRFLFFSIHPSPHQLLSRFAWREREGGSQVKPRPGGTAQQRRQGRAAEVKRRAVCALPRGSLLATHRLRGNRLHPDQASPTVPRLGSAQLRFVLPPPSSPHRTARRVEIRRGLPVLAGFFVCW